VRVPCNMECGKHDCSPAVPGLCNLGNTCYLNAALQAVASSNTFVSCISNLDQAFQATAEPVNEEPVSFVQQLQAGLKAAVKFVLEGRPLTVSAQYLQVKALQDSDSASTHCASNIVSCILQSGFCCWTGSTMIPPLIVPVAPLIHLPVTTPLRPQ
jgi:hypothetical protein